MRCGLVLVLLAIGCLAGASGATAGVTIDVDVSSCARVGQSFALKNLSTAIPDSPISGLDLQVCRSERSCCTAAMEAQLQKQVHRDFSGLLQHNSKSTQGLLASTANSLQDQLTRLSRWSENKTLNLFSQVYKRMAVLARDPIHQLYADIVRYLDTASRVPPRSSSQDVGVLSGAPSASASANAWISSPPMGASMADSVSRFFARLFPLALHSAVAPIDRVLSGGSQRLLQPQYEKCLADKMADVQPFGDAPRALGQSLSKALEAARVLLGALRLGADVLNTTDSLLVDGDSSENQLSPTSECSELLLRVWSCPRCLGLPPTVRPCNGYCLNVLRGCVTSRAAELDQPWAAFVESAARLAGASAAAPAHPGRPRPPAKYQLNAEEAIRQMENMISGAVMYTMEHGPEVERKVKSRCGQPQWIESPELVDEKLRKTLLPRPVSSDDLLLADWTADWTVNPFPTSSSSRYVSQLRDLQDSLLQSNGHFANLAEALCADETFAETRVSEPCWNGERVGEYLRTVVGATASAQKYNPELHWTDRGPDPRIVQLSEKLRHMRQVVLSQLAQAPESDSYVRDEEGSGSGHDGDPQWTDDEDQNVNWQDQGSGSGDDGMTIDPGRDNRGKTSPTELVPGEESGDKKASGAAPISSQSVSVMIMVSLVCLRIAYH